VYKSPQLDLVGWYTIGSHTGPEQRHLPIQMQLQTEYSLESAIFLLFHPELVAQSGGGAGKLPLSLYETVWTSDSSMEVDGVERNQSLKFRELRYSVESGEAEMISVDFVARGGGNATAVEASKAKEDKKGKGKAKDEETNGAPQPEQSHLSAEDDERMATYLIFTNASTNLRQSSPPSKPKRTQSRCCKCA
jgi:COP9 signalosome complex subunit 6